MFFHNGRKKTGFLGWNTDQTELEGILYARYETEKARGTKFSSQKAKGS